MPTPAVERDDVVNEIDDVNNSGDVLLRSTSSSISGGGIAVRSFNSLLWCTIVAATLVLVAVDGKFNAESDVRFELHTRQHGIETYEDVKVDAYGRMDRGPTIFDPKLPTRIFVHGFWSSRRAYLRYARAFLKNSNCNFIAVNWLKGSKTYNYWRARGRVQRVGASVAELIDFLVENRGLQLSGLLVVGHSLGAHIVGVAGQTLRSGKLPIIVGLDPAYPLFSRKNVSNRLSADDAEYVQVIHTNGGHLSIPYPVGDADFYPNWGRDQPGCGGTKTDVCSHGRAHKLYIESLSNDSVFMGLACGSYEEMEEEQCSTSAGMPAVMGTADPVTLRKARGVYYLRTNQQPPYAINSSGIIDEVFNV